VDLYYSLKLSRKRSLLYNEGDFTLTEHSNLKITVGNQVERVSSNLNLKAKGMSTFFDESQKCEPNRSDIVFLARKDKLNKSLSINRLELDTDSLSIHGNGSLFKKNGFSYFCIDSTDT